jgi:chromosome segregation ATPase
MSDHYHYGYAGERHDHRGQYAEDRHDHDNDYAEKYHRHYDDESTVRGLREDLSRAEERTRELEDRVRALEADTPQARRLQYELDATLADNAAAGYRGDEEW